MFQTRRFLVLFSLTIGFSLPLASQAFVARSGDDVNFKSGDQLSGVTYAAGQQITVDTPLPGDLICAGRSVFINQPVQGDIICAAENITIKAKVGGAVRLIASQVNLDSPIEGNAMLFGSDLIIGEQSDIKGETLIAGQFLDSRGRYGQAFHGAAVQAKLYGNYTGAVNLTIADSGNNQAVLQINQGAKLANGLIYRSKLSAQIDPAAEIKGEVLKKDLPNYQVEKTTMAKKWLWSKLVRLFMLLTTGLILISLWPKASETIAQLAGQRPLRFIPRGLLILIAMPLVAVMAAITIIGLPIAVLLLVVWLTLLYMAKLIVGYWLGCRILPQTKNNIWPFLVGTTVLFAISCFPVLGWLVGAIATWWGAGAFSQWASTRNKK